MRKKIKRYIKTYNRSDFKSKRIREAIRLIEERRIFKLRIPEIKKIKAFLLKGKRDYYLTIKGTFCSCYGFTSSLIREKVKPCYHLLACELVDEAKIESIEVDFDKIIEKALDFKLKDLLIR